MREIKFRAKDEHGMEHCIETIQKPLDARGAHNFKGFMNNGGYILRKVNHPKSNSRGYYPEHRLLMEEKLGRILRSDEVVHHINGDRKDNRIENLELMINQSVHATIEMTGKRNPNGTIVANDPMFSEVKFRLYDKDRGICKIYKLSKLINTTFRKGCFEFRGKFTGLHDKNDQPIYEGDVITDGSVSGPCDENMGLLVPTRYVVEFLNGCFVVKCLGCMNDHIFENYHLLWELGCDSEVEVIGNVYQHPHLLSDD